MSMSDMADMSGMSTTSAMEMSATSMSMSSSMSTAMASMSSAMASMSSGMASMSAKMASTATSTAMATSTAKSSMSGMGSMSSKPGACKISMLWNWYTIDACFISNSWHVRTAGDFAGTCISVVAWGVLLQAWLRMFRELDRYLLKKWLDQTSTGPSIDSESSLTVDGQENCCQQVPVDRSMQKSSRAPAFFSSRDITGASLVQIAWWKQIIRAFLHAVDFGASYLFMLMAMYYNGYILICMFLGQLIGYFFFSWDTIGTPINRACC